MNPILYLELTFGNAVFSVETISTGGKLALTSKGLGTLTEAVWYMYGIIAKAPPETRLAEAITLTRRVALRLNNLKAFPISEFEFIIISEQGQLVGINPRFEYNFYDGFNRIILPNKSFSWPKYGNTGILPTPRPNNLDIRKSGIRSTHAKKECCRVKASEVEPEADGIIRFTPEFNIDTKFDNANFYRAQNDNFTEKIFQFVNAPSFNKALFILPKLHKRCKCGDKNKCKHHKNTDKHEDKPATTANNLQLLVTEIYQIALQIQNNQISWEAGSSAILSAIEAYDKYLVAGARSVFYMNMQNGLFFLQFIQRYNLPTKDCSVAFTIDGAIDFTNDNLNDLIFSVSEVPVDEDMSDALYSPIIGIFAYGNVADPEVF